MSEIRDLLLTTDPGSLRQHLEQHRTRITPRLAEVDGTTPDPEGGKIECAPGTAGTRGNPYRTPSGTPRESAAGLVTDVFPDYTVAQYKQGIPFLQKNAAGPLGITGVFDPWLAVDSPAVKAYQRLADAGRLKMRVRGALGIEPDDHIAAWLTKAKAEYANHRGGLFKTKDVRFFADGVIEGHAGYLKEPYADALEAARAINGARDWRPGITHLQLVDPIDCRRFAELGVTAVPQPHRFLRDDCYWYLQLPYLGKDRADGEHRMKRRSGV